MRRRRYQKPRIRNVGGYWIGQYRDLGGVKRKTSLGPVATTTKYQAEQQFARILEPINRRSEAPGADTDSSQFVRRTYFPFYERKWKESTMACNVDRVEHHVMPLLEDRELASFKRGELQDFLDSKAAEEFSYSVVAHLRWDLRQIFQLAVAEGCLERNPAELLFVPPNAHRPEKRVMTFDQVRLFFSVLALREELIGGLAILAGMRPGEIFALQRSHVERDYADIQQRIYRGQKGTPKTFRSKRWAALGDGLCARIRQWLALVPDTDPAAWLFPSERAATPLCADNCWRRHFYPNLKKVGLEWANFQVMRRTYSCLSDELKVDPQVRADQMGHSVDVNQNEYTRASLERRKGAVNALEKALGVM